jgi:DNA repair exonuclease SbcCD ATPase subunit
MDDEKFERQKEFILNQQAQFAAKIGQLEENLARLTGVVERVVDTVDRLARVTAERFEAVDRRADEFDRKLDALVDVQIQNEEIMRKLGERVDRLAATVERHIADGDGGKARPEG